MKRQSKSYTCGIASVANALEVIEISRSQKEISRHCHVTPEGGTNEEEIKRAVLASGASVDEWKSKDANETHVWLEKHLIHYGPVILCVDSSDHWVTVVGICRGNFIIFDPSRNEGCKAYHWAILCGWWHDNEDGYYGLGVS